MWVLRPYIVQTSKPKKVISYKSQILLSSGQTRFPIEIQLWAKKDNDHGDNSVHYDNTCRYEPELVQERSFA